MVAKIAAHALERRATVPSVLLGCGGIAVTLPKKSANNGFLTKYKRDYVGNANALSSAS
jgi:hypothetical protein